MNRDKRWEKVYARMGRKMEYTRSGDIPTEFFEIKIELWHENLHYHEFRVMTATAWDMLWPEFRGMVLDQMVRRIDERLDEQSKRRASCQHFGSCVLDGDCPMFENCYLIGGS